MTSTDPALSGLRVFALDEAWTRSLLADHRTPGLLQRLIKFEGAFLVRQVQLLPGSFVLRLQKMEILEQASAAAAADPKRRSGKKQKLKKKKKKKKKG